MIMDIKKLMIAKLTDLLKIRLASKSFVKNAKGESVELNVFTDEQLYEYLEYGLTAFNSVPNFTFITFNDGIAIANVGIYIVRYAANVTLLSRGLIEKGRQIDLEDQGMTYTSPDIAEFMLKQAELELSGWFEEVKCVKADVKALFVKAL